MPKWFTLDGMNCEDVGIHVMEYPPLCIPKRRGTEMQIPGAVPAYAYDGAWGYENMMLPLKIYVDMSAGVDAVAAFLLPDEREIVFGDQPGFLLRGRCEEQIDLDRIMRARSPRTATINFICSPFKQLQSPGAALEFTGSGEIEHPGTARSYPRMKAEGAGDGAITIGDREFLIYGLERGKPLMIDCGAMICTDQEEKEDWSAKTEGEYPFLDPGKNKIRISGGITKVTIEPKLQWLGR